MSKRYLLIYARGGRVASLDDTKTNRAFVKKCFHVGTSKTDTAGHTRVDVLGVKKGCRAR